MEHSDLTLENINKHFFLRTVKLAKIFLNSVAVQGYPLPHLYTWGKKSLLYELLKLKKILFIAPNNLTFLETNEH